MGDLWYDWKYAIFVLGATIIAVQNESFRIVYFVGLVLMIAYGFWKGGDNIVVEPYCNCDGDTECE